MRDRGAEGRPRASWVARAGLSAGCFVLLAGCEDGPKQTFFPLQPQRPSVMSAPPAEDIFVAGDTKGFGDGVTEDDVGRAKFCAETEENALAQEMVVQPIVPDVSAGGLPLWAPNGGALVADDLIGARSEGKFCNPADTFADAFTWGPTQDVILLFDTETHLVDGVIVTQQYLGAMSGSFSKADGSPVEVVAKPRERLSIAGTSLDVYASRAQAANEPRSWLNPVNVTGLYRMVRETFFGAAPVPDDFDCVAAQICDLVYTSANEDTPQDTVIALQDSGVSIQFTPEGYADSIYLTPVRSAPFENGGALAFGVPSTAQMSFGFQSQFRSGCTLDVDSAISWADFQTRCIASGDERVLDRVNYNVDTARDAEAVEFNGVSLNFLHDPALPLLHDGERPGPADVLYSVGFGRLMPAPVAEFRPLTLGTLYKARLEQRLRGSVLATGGVAPGGVAPGGAAPGGAAPGGVAPGGAVPGGALPAANPFSTFTLTVPFTSDEPQRIAELTTPDGVSWIPTVIDQVAALYASLTPEQRAAVDPKVLDPIYLIEPFVDSVLSAFSHGESDGAGAVKTFRNTEDKRTSVGQVSFRRAGVPYRLAALYSLNFGAITSVQVSRGESAIDRVIDEGRGGGPTPYFEASQMLGGTLVSLGSKGISVAGFDRQLKTLTVNVNGLAAPTELTVSGSPIADVSGYMRQIRGERYEFVPSDQVNFFGKETFLVLWVNEDGSIGKVENRQFKGALELCPGLPITYGDDVQQQVLDWEQSVSPSEYRDCELTFNYSANGNVLSDITSIGQRVSFDVVDGRAVTASVWQ
jgi:hypothetical protein